MSREPRRKRLRQVPPTQVRPHRRRVVGTDGIVRIEVVPGHTRKGYVRRG